MKKAVVALAASLTLLGCQSAPDNSGYRVRLTDTPGPPPAAVTTPGANAPVIGANSDGNAPGIPELHGDIETTPDGLRYFDVTVGAGGAPQIGQTIQVAYTGWLTNGTKFDTSDDHGGSFVFPLGRGQVIRGWDEGLSTMREGGKRRLIIPPQLAYGSQGSPPVIPPNSTLIFDVQLIAIIA
jgi:peptidylprolyl isomerase